MPATTTRGPVQELIAALQAEFERQARGPRIAEILARATAASIDWGRYVHYCPDAYTRNLVHRDETFDLIVLCWDAGQASPIHNHAGQRCWMAVLEGEIRETYYEAPTGAGPLVGGSSKAYRPGRVAYITDDIALHVIESPSGRRAVSLHLYSLPYDECNVYCPTSGQVARKRLVFHTIDGRPVG